MWHAALRARITAAPPPPPVRPRQHRCICQHRSSSIAAPEPASVPTLHLSRPRGASGSSGTIRFSSSSDSARRSEHGEQPSGHGEQHRACRPRPMPLRRRCSGCAGAARWRRAALRGACVLLLLLLLCEGGLPLALLRTACALARSHRGELAQQPRRHGSARTASQKRRAPHRHTQSAGRTHLTRASEAAHLVCLQGRRLHSGSRVQCSMLHEPVSRSARGLAASRRQSAGKLFSAASSGARGCWSRCGCLGPTALRAEPMAVGAHVERGAAAWCGPRRGRSS